jgi:FkbM family methyltransferase
MKLFIDSVFSKYYSEYPIVLIDVGASGGLEPNWKSAVRYLKIIGFEPGKKEFSELTKKESSNVKYLNSALYNKKTTLDFYLMKDQQVSSIIKPNRRLLDKFPEIERFDAVGKTKIETDTLDNLFDIHSFDEPDFIKLDTQGTELSILQGAVDTLRDHIFGIEVEVEFVEIYESQPLFSEVDSFIRKQGFQLFDLQRFYWKRKIGKDFHKKKGQLIFGNALYLRESEDFKRVIDNIQDGVVKKCKVLKAVSICLLYGYFDYAMEVLVMTEKLFDITEYKAIEKRIKRSVRFESKIPHFKGKRFLADILGSIMEIVKPSYNGWASTDRKLGNL